MARKSKIETEKQADTPVATPVSTPVAGSPAGVIGSRPKSPVAISKPKKTKSTPKKGKTVAIKPAPSKKNRPSALVAEPSHDEIRLRAYFIAERRLRLSLGGDSANDWIEARRQLIQEAAPR